MLHMVPSDLKAVLVQGLRQGRQAFPTDASCVVEFVPRAWPNLCMLIQKKKKKKRFIVIWTLPGLCSSCSVDAVASLPQGFCFLIIHKRGMLRLPSAMI